MQSCFSELVVPDRCFLKLNPPPSRVSAAMGDEPDMVMEEVPAPPEAAVPRKLRGKAARKTQPDEGQAADAAQGEAAEKDATNHHITM